MRCSWSTIAREGWKPPGVPGHKAIGRLCRKWTEYISYDRNVGQRGCLMTWPDKEKHAAPASSVPRGPSNVHRVIFDISGDPTVGGRECEGLALGPSIVLFQDSGKNKLHRRERRSDFTQRQSSTLGLKLERKCFQSSGAELTKKLVQTQWSQLTIAAVPPQFVAK